MNIPTSLHLVLLAADVYDSNHMYYGRAMGGEKVSPACATETQPKFSSTTLSENNQLDLTHLMKTELASSERVSLVTQLSAAEEQLGEASLAYSLHSS